MESSKEGGMQTISVIIPARPGTERLSFLDKLPKMDYPLDKIEVIHAEGFQPSVQRNRAARTARGDILYFLDDDSEPIPTLLSRAARHFLDEDVAGVGGPAVAHPDESFWQQCFSSVLVSPFGGFGIQARYRPTGSVRVATEQELILCNFCIRRETFLRHRGFDSRLYPNEENEFYNRLIGSGEKLCYDPEMIVYRFSRRNLKAFFRQIFHYGRGRMEHLWLLPRSFNPFHFVPMFFLIYLVCLVGSSFGRWHLPGETIWPLGVYGLLNAAFSSRIAMEKRSLAFLPCVFLVFFVLHVAYGLGSLAGVGKGAYLRWLDPSRMDMERFRVEVKVIKALEG